MFSNFIEIYKLLHGRARQPIAKHMLHQFFPEYWLIVVMKDRKSLQQLLAISEN